MVYITRRLVKRCKSAGPAFNTRGVFSRPLIRLEDIERIISSRPHVDNYSVPIRDAVVQQIARIRQSVGLAKEQNIVALLFFLTLNVDRLRANEVQLNAYRNIARHYSVVGLAACAAANDFLAATE